MLRGGSYYLKSTFTLTAIDSGTPGAPVIYAAYPGEQPVISGGRPITGWQLEGGQWQTTLPDVASRGWNFTQLFVNHERRYRPRSGGGGYLFIQNTLDPPTGTNNYPADRFGYRDTDIRSDWHNLNDVELIVFNTWSTDRFNVGSVDETLHQVALHGHVLTNETWGRFMVGNRYLAENVREALGKPGQWYLDRVSGILTYLPMPGEKPEHSTVVAPFLDDLVEIHGDIAGRNWVHDISFRGLTFAHSNWLTPPQGQTCPQAGANLPAAIVASGARNCSFETCTVTHTGAYGIELGLGCCNDRVVDCKLTDLGGGGIKIGDMSAPHDSEAVARGNVVSNCTIAHGGRLHADAVGIFIGQSPDNSILHNEIYDFYYSGISSGWSWGFGRSLAHNNTFAYNDIHKIGQAVLSDLGAIYTLGAGGGNVIHHNLLHDISALVYGGNGIYFDEGSSRQIAENNVVYNAQSASFLENYGRDNIVRNNIFALGDEGELARGRVEDFISCTISGNIIYSANNPVFAGSWPGRNYQFDNNIYWRPDGKVPFPNNMTLAQWQATGQDAHSQVADPLFVNVAKRDFRLKPASPALKMGFIPIDLSCVGRIDHAGQPNVPDEPSAFPPPPPPPPPIPYTFNFDSMVEGQKALGLTTWEESEVPAANVRVSDDRSMSGKHSLKFSDAPVQQHDYNPHVFFNPNYTSGRASLSFDLWLGRGALFAHEWRDNATPYHVGPSIYIGADSVLHASGQPLILLPRERWITLSIDYTLGDLANGTYDLTVCPSGGSTAVFHNLTCDRECKKLQWCGWISPSTQSVVFYIDNIRLKVGG